MAISSPAKAISAHIRDINKQMRIRHFDELEHANRLENLRRRIRRVRGREWVDVKSVALKIGKLYVIRRVHFSGGRGEPVAAVWTKYGWDLPLRDLDSGRSIEVWQ